MCLIVTCGETKEVRRFYKNDTLTPMSSENEFTPPCLFKRSTIRLLELTNIVERGENLQEVNFLS